VARLPSFATRVGALLLVLATVAAWAYARVRTRAERTDWTRPVAVLVYVLGAASPEDVRGLGLALDRLERRLGADAAAFGLGGDGPGAGPLQFDVAGPVAVHVLPPVDPPGDAVARVTHALALWRAERAVRDATPDMDPRSYDVRIYLVAAREGGRGFAEGIGAAGGEVGVVRATIADDALLAATAVAHEALHALGATDKYDREGHALVPAGLYAPGLDPPFPQPRAEIMVGELPLGPGLGRLPASAEELGVGPETAREIGWAGAPAGQDR